MGEQAAGWPLRPARVELELSVCHSHRSLHGFWAREAVIHFNCSCGSGRRWRNRVAGEETNELDADGEQG
jgi:hypothetical protein